MNRSRATVADQGGMSRRTLLSALGFGIPGGIVLAGCSVPSPSALPPPPPGTPGGAPFSLGIMSGDPRPGGTDLWTRVDPPADRGPVGVLWTVAEDPGFTTIAAGGVEIATEATDHCISVPVSGLANDRWYFYRFEVDDTASPTGRLRTAPSPDATPDHLRFAVTSCQQITGESWFVTHRCIAEEPGLDFLVHLGDYVYNSATSTITLDQYRSFYRRWRQQPLLRQMQADIPMVAMWDDGEQEFPGGPDRTMDPARAEAARRAWFDYFPLIDPGGRQAYRALTWGNLADIPVADVRSYRDPMIFEIDHTSGPGLETYDPTRSSLGAEQYAWLTGLLGDSAAAWRLVQISYNISPWRLVNLEFLRQFRQNLPPNAGIYAPNDAWDVYKAERTDLLQFLLDQGVSDTVFTSAHTHIAIASELAIDPDDRRSPVVAFDFTSPAMTADPDPRRAFFGDLPERAAEDIIRLGEQFVLSQNAGRMRHLNLIDQGYLLVDVTPEDVTVQVRLVNTYDPNARPLTGAAFRVRKGATRMERLPAQRRRGSFA